MSLNYVKQKADPRTLGKVTEMKHDGNLGFKVVPKALWPAWDLERGVKRSVETSTAERTSDYYAVELALLLEDDRNPPFPPLSLFLTRCLTSAVEEASAHLSLTQLRAFCRIRLLPRLRSRNNDLLSVTSASTWITECVTFVVASSS